MTRLPAVLVVLSTLTVISATDLLHEQPATPRLATAPPTVGVVTRRVWEGADPEFWGTSISPDGRYQSQTNWQTGDAAVLDLLTGAERLVTNFGYADSAGLAYQYAEMTRFSPDGKQLAYTWLGPPDWQYEVRVINVDGTGERVIWRAADEPREQGGSVLDWPDIHGWSPEGASLLVTLWASPKRAEMRLLPLNGSGQQVIYRPAPWKGPSYAAISPDGQYLAFDEGGDPGSREMPDVFVRRLVGAERPISVAPSPGYDGLIGWTTDGRLLLASDRGLTEGVWSVTLRQGRPVGEPTLVKGDLWGIRPIGMARDVVFYGIHTQMGRVHTIGVSLEERRLVGSLRPVEAEMRPSTLPAWSPDGRRLAYRVIAAPRAGSSPELLVIRSTAGESVQKLSGFAKIRQIIWAPDGRRIHVRGDLPGHESKRDWLDVDLSTGEIHVVRTADQVPGCKIPNFIGDHRVVCVYMNADTGFRQVVEYDLESLGRKVRWQVPEGTTDPQRFSNVSLSPDGSRIAFWESDRTGPNLGWVLHLLPATGGEPTDLFSFQHPRMQYASCAGNKRPLWTPDGRHLMITIPEVVLEGKEAGPDACPVYLVPVGGGEPVRIGTLPEHNWWALSPDGGRLAMEAGEPRGEVWVLEGAGR